MPSAWLAEEQALPTANVGPVHEYRIPSVVGAALGMRRGTLRGSGLIEFGVVVIQPVIDRRHAADSGTDDHPGSRPSDVHAVQPRLRHSLIGGGDRELCERVTERQHIGFDIFGRIEIRNLRRDPDASVVGTLSLQFTDLGNSVSRSRPKLLCANARRRNRAHS